MKKYLVQILFQSLLGVFLLPGMIKTPQESEKVILISLAQPGEGETFYAGPSSLLYNIPIQGWVESDLYHSEEVKVILEIFQNSKLVNTQKIYADSSGEYDFYATVNPEGSTENFPATQADCSSYCHYLSELILPAGEITLKLTAEDPAGNQDRLERNIIVDRSDYIYIPLQITLDDSQISDRSLKNIPVTASTRLYMWRSRHFVASTDDHGIAEIRIEALAEAPTHYWLQVEPSIVDGVLYYSEAPVEVNLLPGATSGSSVKLNVKARTGKINGKILGIDKPLDSSAHVLAIRQTDGLFYSEKLSSQGDFVFDDIPLDDYIIVPDLDEDYANNQGVVPETKTINLIESPTASIEFKMSDVSGYALQGEVKGDDSQALPFAWITNEELSITQKVMIDTGKFQIHELPSNPLILIVNAPGYYSRAYSLKSSEDQSQTLSPVLVRQPDTKSISWGTGEIIVPSENIIEVDENRIEFRQGWLWGYNHQASEITIRHNAGDIVLVDGRFAFESLPNRTTWLYILEGNATIHPANNLSAVTVNAGEMVSLIQNRMPIPIPIDQTVVMALHSGMDETSPSVWEPTLNARIRDHLTRIGVNSVQIITFITYGLILISIVGFPFIALYLKLRRQKRLLNEENNETKQ